LKSNTFRIYPTDESSIERLVTKSIVLGDFESAVSLCLSVDRFTDALCIPNYKVVTIAYVASESQIWSISKAEDCTLGLHVYPKVQVHWRDVAKLT